MIWEVFGRKGDGFGGFFFWFGTFLIENWGSGRGCAKEDRFCCFSNLPFEMNLISKLERSSEFEFFVLLLSFSSVV